MGEVIWLIVMIGIIVKVLKKAKTQSDAGQKTSTVSNNQRTISKSRTIEEIADKAIEATVGKEAYESLRREFSQVVTSQPSKNQTSKNETVRTTASLGPVKGKKPSINHAPDDPDHEHIHLNNVNPVQKKLASGDQKNILARANKNTQAYAKDKLHEESCELHEDAESCLGKLEDIMVCGYSGNLNFERNFIGEASDMLANMLTLPYEV